MEIQTVNRQIPINPVKSVRPRANAAALRYWIHVLERPDGTEFYTLRRTAPFSAIHECWGGRELGWCPVTAEYIGKRYKRYGDAYKTMRRLQEQDRVACTADGKRRHLERLAPQMLVILEAISNPEEMPNLEQWVQRAMHTVRIAKRGY